MDYGLTQAETWEAERRIDGTTSRAFLAAHLLTGSAEQAESAVMEAVDSWDPDDDSEEALFERVLNIALRGPISDAPDSPASFLPPELQAVLRLSPQLRRCFVLRILAGLSRQVSARLLRVDCRRVDQYTSAAIKVLPFLTARRSAGVQRATRWLDHPVLYSARTLWTS
jgi:DNA-directed RNA polymerase specialized sigma24 family protein